MRTDASMPFRFAAPPPRRRSTRAGSPRHARRAAAVYLLVLSIAAMVTAAGLALIAARRADQRVYASLQDSAEARYVAGAGIEWALWVLGQTANWRTVRTVGTWTANQPFGPGTFSIEAADDDGNLADDETDALTLTSTGTVNGAIDRQRVTLRPRAHPALAYACLSKTSLELRTAAVIKGPMRANQSIIGDSNVVKTDNASFETVTGYTVESQFTPLSRVSTAMSYPAPSLSYYLSLATPISGIAGSTAKLSGYNLTPTRNSESAAQVNARGIYALNATGRGVVVEYTHIKGTLIIHNTTTKVTVQGSCWIEPAGPSYPTMLIYAGNADVDFDLDKSTLSESAQNVDFNEDGDKADSFTTFVGGIVWTQNSSVSIHNPTAVFRGCVFGNYIRVHDRAAIDEDPALINALVPGFIDPTMKIVSGSWQQVQP